MRSSARLRGRAVIAAAAALLPLTACTQAEPTETLDVLAASSLTGAFDALEAELEAAQPGVDVRISYGSSTALARQVVEGAPADVIATADARSMDAVVDASAVRAPTAFATNTMVLVQPSGAPQLRDLADLATVDFVMCVGSAPCGAIAQQLLDDNDVAAAPRSLEPDVRAVLAKVTSGEADAGLVYRTDVRAAGDAVAAVQIDGAAAATNTYEIAAVLGERSAPSDLAEEWVALVTGPEGRRVLADAGFGLPPEPAAGAAAEEVTP